MNSFWLSKCVDVLYRFVFFQFLQKNREAPPRPFKRILLANCGGFGDVVMCMGIVAEIKRRFPHSQIGFVVLKRSKVALETFLPIDWIHESTYRVRPNQTKLQNLMDYLKFFFLEQGKLAKQIRKIGYDCAIELRPFFPNMTPVFLQSKIPLRIGFALGSHSILLNGLVAWSKDRYLGHQYFGFLEKIGIIPDSVRNSEFKRCHTGSSFDDPLWDRLPAPHEKGPPDLFHESAASGILQQDFRRMSVGSYFIFHLCSSTKRKDFSCEFWKKLYEKCRAQGYSVYFTGQGDRDNSIITQVVDEECYNLCDKLKWKEFVQLIKESRGIVSVDSVPVHIAAYFNIPCAVLFLGTCCPKLWHPDIATCTAFGIESPVEVEEIMSLMEKWVQ